MAEVGPRVSLTRLWTILAMLVVVLAYQALTGLLGSFKFGLNQTGSLPNWAFITNLKNRDPGRGDHAVFIVPDNAYYPRDARFVKVVAGVAGDRVERRGRDFYVNGRFVGTAKPRSRTGRVEPPGPTGVIPRGHYFVVTPHADSLDSRYAVIGWIGRERVVGVAEPVL